MVKGYYPAMTPGEFAAVRDKPDKIAWMSCRFSPDDTGLTNLPDRLPSGSILILDDSVLPGKMDATRIRNQLAICIDRNRCCGLLLDFQREKTDTLSELAGKLCTSLPCPAAVTPPYAMADCPVLLPPIPPDCRPGEYLRPYKGTEVWCELSFSSTEISISEAGSKVRSAPMDLDGRQDGNFFCHYNLEVTSEEAIFRLFRRKGDLRRLMAECESLGVHTWLGLWQELGTLE